MNRFKLVVNDNGALMQHDSNGDYVKAADVFELAGSVRDLLDILKMLKMSTSELLTYGKAVHLLVQFETGKPTPPLPSVPLKNLNDLRLAADIAANVSPLRPQSVGRALRLGPAPIPGQDNGIRIALAKFYACQNGNEAIRDVRLRELVVELAEAFIDRQRE